MLSKEQRGVFCQVRMRVIPNSAFQRFVYGGFHAPKYAITRKHPQATTVDDQCRCSFSVLLQVYLVQGMLVPFVHQPC